MCNNGIAMFLKAITICGHHICLVMFTKRNATGKQFTATGVTITPVLTPLFYS